MAPQKRELPETNQENGKRGVRRLSYHEWSIQQQEETEHRTVLAVGLPAGNLSAEEQKFLPKDIDLDSYLSASTSKKLQTKHAEIIALAWNFLDHFGFINFGVSPAIDNRMRLQPDDQGAVIIIGAGLAGLAAARQLRMKGHRVVVLEARSRIGGRVESQVLQVTKIESLLALTCELQADGQEVIVELGGSIVSGIDGNPLAVIASQLDIPLHRITNETPLHFSDGSRVPKSIDKQSERLYNKLLDRCGACREFLGNAADHVSLGHALDAAWGSSKAECPDQKKQLVQWHFANLEFANASVLDQISLRGWDQDDPYTFRGAHVFLSGGNGQLINALAKNVNILCNQTVTRVKYAQSGIEVCTGATVHKADCVLVTVPLGVLKKQDIVFDPPFSQRKQGAIDRLGYGTLNKVVMWFPTCFWSEKGDIFGSVNQTERDRGKAFLFYSYAAVAGGAVLIALVAGHAAEAMESRDSNEALVDEVLHALRRIFDIPDSSRRSARRVPTPIKVCCTQWGKDPYAYGSYSSVQVGSSGSDDYDILAENIGERVFFAGEATSKRHPATMHGAFMSGLREAAFITAALKKMKGTL